MNLIVVESPTKAKTISRFLGKDFKILASMGHIRDLPAGKLGVDVKNNFEPLYVQVPGKKEVVKELKEAVGRAKEIYLATDPDREGEAIAYHIRVIGEEVSAKGRSASGPEKKNFLRITFHEITKTAIEKAMVHPGKLNMRLVNAQQARRVLDRLVGYKLSPLLWYKIRKGLSAGRVQSIAVRLIVDREREIEKFVPEEYWDIGCNLRKKIGRKRSDLPTFPAKLFSKNGQAAKVSNQVEAEEIVKELKKAGYEVDRIEQKELKRSPLPPFITSTLQRTAFAKFGFSSKQTMRLAQQLYEKGLITYHRTDSVALSREALDQIRGFVKSHYQEFLPEKPNFYKTRSKVAQEAHEAIRPTDIDRAFEKINFRDERGKKLYQLIFNRAVASQMKPAIFDQTKVFIRADGSANVYLLLSQGKVIKFPGWLILYGLRGKSKTGQDKNPELEEMPSLKRADELSLVEVLAEQKFTQPPPRYNEASLVKALEEKGIGRPSTYAPTISTIQDRQYVEKEEKKLKPTVLGITVNDFLMDYFADVLNYDFTARMEDELDEIARGEKKWAAAINDFYEPFIKKLRAVSKVAERVRVPVETIGRKCPECKEGELVIRVGRFGKFVSCSRFPDCKYKEKYLEKVEGIKCPKCGGDVVVKKSKKGGRFYGCSNWPKCDWATWRKPHRI
ncbi:MAG: type I DNA topoisomerase [Candidatus Pacebacteria bacterium]|nr:type I DNA topoisomerase [Candidatus Paceibacterota bacterium]